ncbi:PROTEIN NEGATIVE REGULATOR OF RESISTANCE [Salix koriyanagi]|uniref:PROTEIN NEGATIVE REGULATOR OF RESISTANCE n=1 Tax=Salix koriyanagi TaxID=2511006 RepID=A0A9Q0U4J5_9ROSI|nr:PROTEIN NEGATIVE REGULATOR OF RESISTANCE [Salix koriyanagi]
MRSQRKFDQKLSILKSENHRTQYLTLTFCINRSLREASQKQPRRCISHSACEFWCPDPWLAATSMDGASKKRKLFHDDLDEENEEEKIEKFFALINGIREARDRLMSAPDLALKLEMDTSNGNKRKLEEEKKQFTVWKPSFQREDFMEETEMIRNPPAAAASAMVDSSQRKEVTEKDDRRESLDLNLSL